MVEVRRHTVGGTDGAKGQDLFIGAGVAHDTDGLDRQEHSEGLPDLVIETRLADFLQIDGVRLLKRGDRCRRDLAGNADGQSRPRERMATDKGVAQSQFTAQRPHFILEQVAQRFDQLQLHEVRQAADIVMTLDDGRRTA